MAEYSNGQDRDRTDRHSVRFIVEQVRAKRAQQAGEIAPPVEIAGEIEELEQPSAEKKRKTPRKKKGDGIRPEPDLDWLSENDDDGATHVENAVAKCPGLSLGATGIYTFIASFAFARAKKDGGGWKDEVWPGMETISERFAITETTVKKYLDELIEWGLIERTRRGRNLTNVYKLTCRQAK